MGIKKDALLTEIAGVPKAIDRWVEVLTTMIMGLSIAAETDDKKWTVTNGVVAGHHIKKLKIKKYSVGNQLRDHFVKQMFGTSDVKELLQNDDFKKLPLVNPEIEISFTGIPSNVWGDNRPVVVNASFQTDSTTKMEDGGLINTKFTFDIIYDVALFHGGDFEKKLEKVLRGSRGSVAHELVHAYQRYQEGISKGIDGPFQHFGKESALNWVTQVMENTTESKDWNSFLTLVYYHLSFEVNARVGEAYYDMATNDVDTTEKFKEYIRGGRLYNIADRLEKFDAEDFIKTFEAPFKDLEKPEWWSGDGVVNINWFKMTINPIRNWYMLRTKMSKDKTSKFMMWSLIKRWSDYVDLFETMQSNQYKEGNFSRMEPVPEKAKKDPMVFFKFFEDRFHKSGKDFKRKLYRLGSLIQDKERKMGPTNKNGRIYNKGGFDNMVKEATDDFDWMDDTSPLSAKLTYSEIVSMLRDIFKNTRYSLYTVDSYHFTIRDHTGQYKSYDKPNNDEMSINDVLDELDTSSIDDLEQHIHDEYSHLVKTIKSYFNMNESDDFDWVETIYPTLGDIFDNGAIDIGDIIHVKGETLNADGDDVSVDGKITINHLGMSQSFHGMAVTFDDELIRVLNVSQDDHDTTELIDYDRNLVVVSHQKGNNINESDELDWIKDVHDSGTSDLEIGNEFEVMERVSTLKQGETFIVMDKGAYKHLDNRGEMWVKVWVNGDENVSYSMSHLDAAIKNGKIEPRRYAPKELPINESDDLEWMDDTSTSGISLLKDRMDREFPNIEMEIEEYDSEQHDFILRVLISVRETDTHILDEGMAFVYDKISGSYSVGDYDDMWISDFGGRGELIDTDLSFWAWGDEDRMINTLKDSLEYDDGSPYRHIGLD